MNTEERFKNYYEFTQTQWLCATSVYKEQDLLFLLDTDRLILAKNLKPFGFRPISRHSIKIATKRTGWKRAVWKVKTRKQRRRNACVNVA